MGEEEGEEGARAIEGFADVDSLIARYPVDQRARDYLESSPPEVLDRALREFRPPREGESDYSGLLTSFVKRLRAQGGAVRAAPWRMDAASDRRHDARQSAMQRLQDLVERYPVDDTALAAFEAASPEVQERILRDFKPPRPGEADYSALFMSFMKKCRLDSGHLAMAAAPTHAQALPPLRPLRPASPSAAGRGWAGRQQSGHTGGGNAGWQAGATPPLRDFLARYPIDDRAIDFLSMQTPELQGRVLRDFRPKVEGEADYSSLFMAFCKRCRTDAEVHAAQAPPPLQPLGAHYGGGHRASPAPYTYGKGNHHARGRADTGHHRPASGGGALAVDVGPEAVEAFARRFPMDDRAFAYLCSSTEEVRYRVLNEFRPPRENDTDYSAPVTAFVKNCRKACGQGPGVTGGLLDLNQDNGGHHHVRTVAAPAGGEYRDKISLDPHTEGVLHSFFERYPVDERAANYLSQCSPDIIERVVREFVPKREGEKDYSAIVTSFTKRIRGQAAQDYDAPWKRPRHN